ncbi:MAG: hypothetical protein JWO86_526 [Myxococcaceae bacterium]|nr:hypothetical protein [Myxococcaceae bacterium]
MTQPFYARWAGRFLGAYVEESPRVDERERATAISAIEQAIRERGRRRARTRWAIGSSAAAAAILCIGAGAQAYRAHSATVAATAAAAATTTATAAAGAGSGSDAPPVTITASANGLGATIASGPGAAFALADAAHVAPGHRIVARGRSRATLAFSTGTQLTVENGGDLAVVEEGRSQIFALSAGEIRARVAKLGAGERFVVRTPDAEVEVRGTSFSVAIVPSEPSCGGGSVTRVTVDEGVVVVRRGGGPGETRVARGEEWPQGCDVTGPSGNANLANGDIGDNPHADHSNTNIPASRHASRREGASANANANANANATSASSLVEQNNLFSEALAYKNGGQHAAAVAAFERFLAKYPSSNLAENAAVERMKLLLADDPPRGVVAARQYLRRYPNGFAQTDARAAVAAAP